MGFVAESWFIDAFQDHFDDFLHQLIVPGLDTERTLLIAVFLRNIDPLCRLWTVTVISQRRDDLIDFLVTHAINRRSIGSTRSYFRRWRICFYTRANRTPGCTDFGTAV